MNDSTDTPILLLFVCLLFFIVGFFGGLLYTSERYEEAITQHEQLKEDYGRGK